MTNREYRLAVLLWVYPTSYPEKRGDEILGTSFDSTPPSNRPEMARDVIDVLASQSRRASPKHTTPRAAGGLCVITELPTAPPRTGSQRLPPRVDAGASEGVLSRSS